MANEEYWVEIEEASLRNIREEYTESEVKDYVLENAYNPNDTHEEKSEKSTTNTTPSTSQENS